MIRLKNLIKSTLHKLEKLYASVSLLESIITFLKGFTPPEIKCRDPLGIESGKTPSIAIAASTMCNQYWGPDRGRLPRVKEGSFGGGWAAQYNDAKQFIQFDLGNGPKVTALATQGRSDADWMVTSYTLAFSLDGGNFIPFGAAADGQGRKCNISSMNHSRKKLARLFNI